MKKTTFLQFKIVPILNQFGMTKLYITEAHTNSRPTYFAQRPRFHVFLYCHWSLGKLYFITTRTNTFKPIVHTVF